MIAPQRLEMSLPLAIYHDKPTFPNCTILYQPNCSQCNSTLGPLMVIHCAAVLRTVSISAPGPQPAITTLSSGLALATTSLISLSTSGRPGIATRLDVESQACERVDDGCFSISGRYVWFSIVEVGFRVAVLVSVSRFSSSSGAVGEGGVAFPYEEEGRVVCRITLTRG